MYTLSSEKNQMMIPPKIKYQILSIYHCGDCLMLLASVSGSSLSSSSSMILMSLMEGLWLRLHPSITCGIRVFVSSLGPDNVIMIAPVGAVNMMDRTHIIRTFSAYPVRSSANPTRWRATGPRAAYEIDRIIKIVNWVNNTGKIVLINFE